MWTIWCWCWCVDFSVVLCVACSLLHTALKKNLVQLQLFSAAYDTKEKPRTATHSTKEKTENSYTQHYWKTNTPIKYTPDPQHVHTTK
jgi:membrane-associated HD superfamily phosphohydrolase